MHGGGGRTHRGPHRGHQELRDRVGQTVERMVDEQGRGPVGNRSSGERVAVGSGCRARSRTAARSQRPRRDVDGRRRRPRRRGRRRPAGRRCRRRAGSPSRSSTINRAPRRPPWPDRGGPGRGWPIGAGRRDPHAVQARAGQLGEHRGGGGASVDGRSGFVDDHDDGQLRVLRGHHSRERGHVVVVAGGVVVAAFGLRLARRPGLAGHRVALDLGPLAGADRTRPPRASPAQPAPSRPKPPGARPRWAWAAGRRRGRRSRRRAAVRRRPVVGDHVVRLQHLQGGDRDAAARWGSSRSTCPTTWPCRAASRGIRRELQPRGLPEPEGPEVRVDAVLAQRLGDLDRADVGRLGQDLGRPCTPRWGASGRR